MRNGKDIVQDWLASQSGQAFDYGELAGAIDYAMQTQESGREGYVSKKLVLDWLGGYAGPEENEYFGQFLEKLIWRIANEPQGDGEGQSEEWSDGFTAGVESERQKHADPMEWLTGAFNTYKVMLKALYEHRKESGRESARKLIAKWRTEAKEDHKHGDWDLAKEKERCADELETALGASATDSASVRGASNCLKVPLRMGSADVSASTPETGAAAIVCRVLNEKNGLGGSFADNSQCVDFAKAIEAALVASATESASVTDVGAGPVKPSDASRICSTEREPNVHETGAAMQGDGEDAECICRGNWRSIVKETEHLIGNKFKNSNGQVWTFLGILHSDDDYYYVMSQGNNAVQFLSCVASFKGHGYEPVERVQAAREPK